MKTAEIYKKLDDGSWRRVVSNDDLKNGDIVKIYTPKGPMYDLNDRCEFTVTDMSDGNIKTDANFSDRGN